VALRVQLDGSLACDAGSAAHAEGERERHESVL